jgi:putative peptidoglycan lipid II flippase
VSQAPTFPEIPANPGAPGTPEPGHAALAGAVRAVSGVTLLSRFAGLVREVLIVRIFGQTALGSAFVAAFAIPNLFRRLFGEGALSAAFIPEYTQAHASRPLPEAGARVGSTRPPGPSDRFASLTLLLLLLVTTALTVLGELGLLVAILLSPGNAERILSLKLVMVMLPFMPLVCAAAILGGMLQVHGRFAPAAAGPVILNTLIVATGLYFLLSGKHGDPTVAYALGVATVISGLTQSVWFLRLLRPHVRWTRDFGEARGRARRMLRRFVPVLIGMGTLQINTFLDTIFAMWHIWIADTMFGRPYPMDDASNIILASAQRLYQFPLGVFGIAVATAVFPLLSRHADEPEHFLQTLRRGLRLSLFIGVPASIGLILVRRDLIAVLYSGGGSGLPAGGVSRSAAALAGFAPGVWAYSLNHVLTRAFYARGDTRTPMRIAIGLVGFNLALNLALIWPLREAGLAWATSISAAIQCVILTIVLARKARLPGRIIDPATVQGALKIVFAAAAMAGAVLALRRFVGFAPTWSGNAAAVAACTGAGGLAYLGASWLLKCHELRWLLKLSS